jgi:DNA invertase Pin-like site-specific DNA recombinase
LLNLQANKAKAAIYCRVASADETALEIQRRTMRDFAAQQVYENCAEYLDNGESGLTLNRPAFSQLSNDLRTGKIDVVFINCISRIGRDYTATHEWLDEMRALGVRVVSRNEGAVMPYELYTIFAKPQNQ